MSSDVLYNDESVLRLFSRIHSNVKICDECGNSAKKCCSGCNRVWYCKRACQNKSWKNGHRHLCKILKNITQTHIDYVVNINLPPVMSCCLNCTVFRYIGSPLLNKRTCCVCGDYCRKKCSKCEKVYFCSEECQKEGWDEHKITCDFIASLNLDDIARMVPINTDCDD